MEILNTLEADLHSANISRNIMTQFAGEWFFLISIWGERNVLFT